MKRIMEKRVQRVAPGRATIARPVDPARLLVAELRSAFEGVSARSGRIEINYRPSAPSAGETAEQEQQADHTGEHRQARRCRAPR